MTEQTEELKYNAVAIKTSAKLTWCSAASKAL